MKFDTLVLGSCHSAPFLLLGFLHRLHTVDFINNIERYSSCSSGSIINLLLICNYTPKDIIEECIDNPMLLKCLSNVYDDELEEIEYVMRNILRSLVMDKFSIVPTMKQLHLMTGKFFHFTIYEGYKKIVTHEDEYSCIDIALQSLNIPINKMLHNEYLINFADSSFVDTIPIPDVEGDFFPVHIIDKKPTNSKIEHILSYLYKNNCSEKGIDLINNNYNSSKQLYEGIISANKILEYLDINS